MRFRRLILCPVLLALSTWAVAQPDPKAAFDKLKSLEGAWEGEVTTVPPQPEMQGKRAKLWLRVTSMGNAIMHEMKPEGMPDNPITMLYRDAEQLMLTHYCDAGNRPRMTGTTSPDGKTIKFEFLDITGSTQYGHMHRAAFTFIDENHHIEEWTYMMKGNNPVRARFDLRRVPANTASN